MPDIAGIFGANQSTFLQYDEWWLKDLDNDANSYSPEFFGPIFYRSQKEEIAEFNPLNRSKIVVLRGVIRGEVLELPFECTTQEEFDKFTTIRATQKTLLLQRGYTEEQWYISLGSERPAEEAAYDNTYRKFVIQATEVDPP